MGDLQNAENLDRQLPLLRSFYLEWPLIGRLRELTTEPFSLSRSLHKIAIANDVRLISCRPLNVYYDADVGGTREIASRSRGLDLVPAQATDEMFAETLVDVVIANKENKESRIAASIRRDFSSHMMTVSYSRLYERAISMHNRTEGDGILLVINNFLTGGAQSSARRLLMGTVARISHQKKLEELIEAIRLATPTMPAFRLQIVGGLERGSEDYAEQMRERSRGLPIDWLGEQSDPSRTMRLWDFFVLISEPMGCPNTGQEAMSHGLPMVATDAGGASEQVVNGLNGRLFPRRDIRELAKAICELANSVELRIRNGKASLERYANHFNVERMIEDYARVFGVLARQPCRTF